MLVERIGPGDQPTLDDICRGRIHRPENRQKVQEELDRAVKGGFLQCDEEGRYSLKPPTSAWDLTVEIDDEAPPPRLLH